MKTHTFTVTLEFNDPVNIDLIGETREQILFALINHVDFTGLAPVDSDTWTTGIEVTDPKGDTINHHFNM